jgi:hypothetical protein
VEAEDGLDLLELMRFELEGALIEPADSVGMVLFTEFDEDAAVGALDEVELDPGSRERTIEGGEGGA